MISRFYLCLQQLMSDDNTQARNLADDLFADLGLELPAESSIQPRPPAVSASEGGKVSPDNNDRKSKYGEEDDDALWNIDLAPVSSIPGSQNNNKNSQSIEKQQPKPVKNSLAPISRVTRKGKSTGQKGENKKQTPQNQPQLDIDAEIGEVAEWAQRGVKNNSDEEDFDDGPQAPQTNEQAQIRKRIADKLRNDGCIRGGSGSLGGLKAKAEQLKRENNVNNGQKPGQSQKISESHKLPSIEEKFPQPCRFDETTQDSLGIKKDRQSSQHMVLEESNFALRDKQPEVKPTTSYMIPKKGKESKMDEDDPWEKVNQQTIQQFQHNADKRKTMTLQSALVYFEQFSFDPQDIDNAEIGGSSVEEEEEEDDEGFFASLCACLKPSPKRKPKFNPEIAKRLVAISKKQLSSVEQEFFILKQIWFRLTAQQFSRYGGHWNLIGFQGRDPATDLRSTGVLSLVQWAAFLQRHPSLSEKYSKWSMAEQFPLALSHIKLTGAFLDLLSRGVVRYESWKGFQNAYNCLVIGFFDKMMKEFKGGEMGSSVEEQVRTIKQGYRRLSVVYEREFQPSRK